MTVDPMTSPSPSNCPSVTHSQVPSRLEITELWIQLFRPPANCLLWKKNNMSDGSSLPRVMGDIWTPIVIVMRCCYIRRTFRSQTSHNISRWKSRGGKSQSWESQKEEDQRREGQKKEGQKKEGAGARKGRNVAKHCVFPMFWAQEGRKVGSLKRRVWSHLGKWEMNNCTPLWREADFEVKRPKTP